MVEVWCDGQQCLLFAEEQPTSNQVEWRVALHRGPVPATNDALAEFVFTMLLHLPAVCPTGNGGARGVRGVPEPRHLKSLVICVCRGLSGLVREHECRVVASSPRMTQLGSAFLPGESLEALY